MRFFIRDAKEIRTLLSRALALGHAALDKPTSTGLREARKFLARVLSMIDEKLLGGELTDLFQAARQLVSAIDRKQAAALA